MRSIPAVGDWPDVAALAADYELMFDAVINHAVAESAWFHGFKAGVVPFDGYFVRANPAADYSAVVRPRALPLLTEVETTAGPVHVWTTFSADQVDLDYRNPNLLLEVLDILLDYCAKGARFIRLDAIGFMWKEPGTGCMHLPETHALVQVMRELVEATAPGTLIITETNVPHAENVSYFGDVAAPEAHLVYQYPLPPLVQHAFQTGDAGGLIGLGSGARAPNGSTRPYELNISYIDGLVPAEADDQTRAAAMIAAHGILLSSAGLPWIYIHSLLGSRSDHAGMAATGRHRSINRARLDAAAVRADLDGPVSLQHLVFSGIAHLLRTRAGEPALHPDATPTVHALDPALFVVERRTGGGRRLLAAINVSREPRELWAADAAKWSDILTGERFVRSPIAMAPYAVRWLVAEDSHR